MAESAQSAKIQISSNLTFVAKRVFPTIWFGVVGICLAVSVIKTALLAVFIILLMATLGYVIMSAVVFDLADKVWDCGEFLIVRNSGEDERIPLTQITNVGYAGYTNPRRVVLTVRRATKVDQVSFFPRLWPRNASSFRLAAFFFRHPVATDLAQRIDEAKRRT